jgi:hypothetical protein
LGLGGFVYWGGGHGDGGPWWWWGARGEGGGLMVRVVVCRKGEGGGDVEVLVIARSRWCQGCGVCSRLKDLTEDFKEVLTIGPCALKT